MSFSEKNLTNASEWIETEEIGRKSEELLSEQVEERIKINLEPVNDETSDITNYSNKWFQLLKNRQDLPKRRRSSQSTTSILFLRKSASRLLNFRSRVHLIKTSSELVHRITLNLFAIEPKHIGC